MTAYALITEGMHALQLFEPDPQTIYSIEAKARLVNLPRHAILVYCKYGLVSSVVDPDRGGFYFDDKAIRLLRRIEYLRTACGISLLGIKSILDLMDEVERLRSEARFLRRR